MNNKDITNNQQSIVTSPLVLPDTTTNILADASSNNFPKRQQDHANWNSPYNYNPKNLGQFGNPTSTNNNFLREFLHGKLALAAAVVQRQQLQHADYQQLSLIHIPSPRDS